MSTKPKNPAAVALGRLGGKAGTGPAKARTNAKEASRERWRRYYEQHPEKKRPTH